MNILAIIPARGGSKGVPGKNIMEVDGKPLLAYAIECAEKSKMITRYIVSTDCKKTKKIAEDLGAEVLERPIDLATDSANIVDTVKQVINELEKSQEIDIVVLLQPTAPLRTGSDIDKALRQMIDNNYDAVLSVVESQDVHPARMYSFENYKLNSLQPINESVQRQLLPPIYLRNGCIYAIYTRAFKRYGTLMPDNKTGYVMPFEWAVNVDTQVDLYVLEKLLPGWKKKNL